MATLIPRVGERYLKPDEVIGRVKVAFAYVETTTEGARRQVLDWMNQLAFVAAEGRAATDDNYLAQLERLQDDALFVHFGADGALLSMLLIPGQPIIIDYSPQVQKADLSALIARCARVLTYDIVEQADTEESVGLDPQHSAPRAAAV